MSEYSPRMQHVNEFRIGALDLLEYLVSCPVIPDPYHHGVKLVIAPTPKRTKHWKTKQALSMEAGIVIEKAYQGALRSCQQCVSNNFGMPTGTENGDFHGLRNCSLPET